MGPCDGLPRATPHRMTRLLPLLLVVLSGCLDGSPPALPPPAPPTTGSSDPFFTLSVDAWSGTQGTVSVSATQTVTVPIRINRFNDHTSQITLRFVFDPHPEFSANDPAVTYEVPCYGALSCCSSMGCTTRVPQDVDEVPLTITASSLARLERHQHEIRGESAAWNRGYPLLMGVQIGPRAAPPADAGGLPTVAAWRHLTRVDGGITAMAFSTPAENTADAQARLVIEGRRSALENGNPYTIPFDFSVPAQSFTAMSDSVGLFANERVTSVASAYASDGRYYVARMHVRNNALRFRLDRAEAGSTELNLVTLDLLSSSSGVVSVTNASMAAGPNGAVDLVWREYRQSPSGGTTSFQARRFDPAMPAAAPFPVVLSGQNLDSAVVVGGPTLRAVTVETRSSWTTPHVLLTELPPGGAALLATTTIDETSFVGGRTLSAAAGPNGELYVAYGARVTQPTGTSTERLIVKRVSGGVVTDLSPMLADFGIGSVSRSSVLATSDGTVFAAFCSGFEGRAFVGAYENGSWTAMTDGDPSPLWVAEVQLGYGSFGPRRVLYRALRVEDFYRRGGLEGVHLQSWSLR